MGFLLRRALAAGLLLLATSAATFLLAELAPGDVLDELRLDPRVPSETLAALEARYGLDAPLPVRYLSWLGAAVHGDFGHSLTYGLPVTTLLRPRLAATLLLTGSATALAWLIALPLGCWMAWRRGSWLDRLGQTASSALLATPQVVLGLGALLLAAGSGAFPLGGMNSPGLSAAGFWSRGADLLWHLALPVAALALTALPVLLAHVRTAVAEQLKAPFVTFGHAAGVGRLRLLFRSALPATAAPLVSLFGLSLGGLLSGSLLIEVILGWPGLGPLLLEAVLARDVHVVAAVTLLSCALLVAGNLLADGLLYWLDPRHS